MFAWVMLYSACSKRNFLVMFSENPSARGRAYSLKLDHARGMKKKAASVMISQSRAIGKMSSLERSNQRTSETIAS